MVHCAVRVAASLFVSVGTLVSQAQPDIAQLHATLRTIVAVEGAGVVGEGVHTLTEWGPEPVDPVPRIRDARELWPPGARHGINVRPGVAAVPSESAPSKGGRPALELLRDVLPGAATGSGFVRAVVLDPCALAGEPSHLQVLHCHGGDPAVLADALPRFTSLQQVRLGPLLDNRVAAALAACRALISLHAVAVGLGDEGVLALGSASTLRSLTLAGDVTALSGQTVPALKRLQCLRVDARLEPWLSSAGEPGGLLRSVLQLPNLHELQFGLTNLPPDQQNGESGLLPSLRAMPKLRWLSIDANGESLGTLARGLSALPLERLRLSGWQIATADLEALTSCRSLRQLDLRAAQFADPAAAEVVLAKATHLRRIGVAFSNLEPPAIERLIEARPHCIVQTGLLRPQPDGRILRELIDRQATPATSR